MYKMIILDLDGTLLNDYKEVSKENIEMIKRAYQEKGIISVIATGRPLGYAEDVCNLCGNCFTNYIIASNGAIIKDTSTNEYIHQVSFTNEEIISLRNIFVEEKADYMMLFTDKQAITETRGKQAIDNAGINLKERKVKTENIEEKIRENPELIKTLCIIGGEIQTLEKIKKKAQEIEEIETSVISNYVYKNGKGTFKSKYIDINKKECNKKNGIQALAGILKIKPEEIIVMGDGGNDISMFETAGLKIAMANAEEYLKEKADYITSSNNESGVARAIKKFIFNEK